MLLAAVANSFSSESKSRASVAFKKSRGALLRNSHGLGASLANCQAARRAWRYAKNIDGGTGADGKALSTKPHA
ncbi:MAG TPA: hypothetical protein VE713_13445, partial [Pyrinomonadaceae bacterium]|nr:hypothetical protein [Pyrinomonadaceae bacterium]